MKAMGHSRELFFKNNSKSCAIKKKFFHKKFSSSGA